MPAELADAPDLVSALLEGLVSQVPGEAYATGLATCAVACPTTEDLLAATVGRRAPEVWAWLARPARSSARSARGLILHDLARDVLDAEFERRHPNAYAPAAPAIVHDRGHAGCATHRSDRRTRTQQLILLHRRSPLTSRSGRCGTAASAAVVPAAPEDRAGVLEIVDRFSGARDRRALPVAGSTRRPPEACTWPGGDRGGSPSRCTSAADRLGDSNARTRWSGPCWSTSSGRSPLRPGEQIHLTRVLGGASAGTSATVYAGLVSSVIGADHLAHRPLAWSFTAPHEEFWGPFFEYLGFGGSPTRLRRPPIYGLRVDWRRLPLDGMDLRATGSDRATTGPRAGRAAAARAAGPGGLRRGGPGRAAGPAPRRPAGREPAAWGPGWRRARRAPPPGLPDSLRRASPASATPAQGRARCAGCWTAPSCRPAPTQEAAAEVLGLPFSTYRRHLPAATRRAGRPALGGRDRRGRAAERPAWSSF